MYFCRSVACFHLVLEVDAVFCLNRTQSHTNTMCMSIDMSMDMCMDMDMCMNMDMSMDMSMDMCIWT